MPTIEIFSMLRKAGIAGLLTVICGTWAIAAAPIDVPIIRLSAQPAASNFELDGVIEPVKQSVISAQISGRIASLEVRAGDRVRKGQLLVTIDDREVQTGVQRSRAQLAQAEAELRNAEATLTRTRQLQREGFLSKAALDTAEMQYKAAQAGRDQATAVVQQSILTQEFSRVTAPYDGYIAETQVQAGDLAAPGKPLMLLYAPAPMRAVVHVPVSLSGIARSASTVEIQLPANASSARWVQPSGQQVLSAADPVAQTIEWRLDLGEGDQTQLVPGQQVRVKFTGGLSRRLVIPSTAVLHRGELTAVYVVSGSAFVLKVIRLGSDHGAVGVEVLSGLSADEQIAADPIRAGLNGARPGAIVTAPAGTPGR